MLVSWKDRLDALPHLWTFSNWPRVDCSALPKNKQRIYTRNLKIVSLVLSGVTCRDAAKESGVSAPTVAYLLKRCLGGDHEESPALTIGCIPNKHCQAVSRTKPHSTLTHPSGHRGEFSKLLKENTVIVERLDAFIQRKLKDKDDAFTLSPASVHSEFKRILDVLHWPRDRYPYNTDSLAYHSIINFLNSRVLAHQLKPHKNKTPFIAPLSRIKATPLREVEIDEQLIHSHVSVNVEFEEKLVRLRLARASIIVAVDKDTNCVLAYHLCLTAHPSKEDVLHLLQHLVSGQPTVKVTTPGFRVLHNEYYPRLQLDNGCLRAINTIKLDNALAHLANDVRHTVVAKLGATLSLSKKGIPKARNWVEQAMQVVNRAAHAFASTTGSHVRDPIRETKKNFKKPPKLEFHQLNEAFQLVFGDHNNAPKGSLVATSPLEAFEQFSQDSFGRVITPGHVNDLQCVTTTTTRTVKLINNENRLPFVNFAGTRYSGACLAKTELINARITLKVDLNDARTILAVDNNGKALGTLYAPRSWCRYKHSFHLRKLILKLVRQNVLSRQDPLIGYQQFLLERANKPKYALRLTRLLTSASQYGEISGTEVENAVNLKERGFIQKQETCDLNVEFANNPIKEWDDNWASHHG